MGGIIMIGGGFAAAKNHTRFSSSGCLDPIMDHGRKARFELAIMNAVYPADFACGEIA